MTPDPAPNDNPVEKLSYELAYAELEAIITALETDSGALENSLALFQRGQLLIQHCAALLDDAEIKVRQLSGDTLSDLGGSNISSDF